MNLKWNRLDGTIEDAKLVKIFLWKYSNFGLVDKENYLVDESTDKIIDALKGHEKTCHIMGGTSKRGNPLVVFLFVATYISLLTQDIQSTWKDSLDHVVKKAHKDYSCTLNVPNVGKRWRNING